MPLPPCLLHSVQGTHRQLILVHVVFTFTLICIFLLLILDAICNKNNHHMKMFYSWPWRNQGFGHICRLQQFRFWSHMETAGFHFIVGSFHPASVALSFTRDNFKSMKKEHNMNYTEVEKLHGGIKRFLQCPIQKVIDC